MSKRYYVRVYIVTELKDGTYKSTKAAIIARTVYTPTGPSVS